MKYDKVTRKGNVYFRWRNWDSILKKYTKTLYGLTLKELKSKVDKYLELSNAGVIEDDGVFVDFCKNWLYNIHLMDKKPSTKARYDTTFNCHIKDSRIGKMKLQDVTANDLQKWYNKIFEKKGEHVVKNIHKVIRPCLRYAFKSGHILRNHGELVTLPKDLKVKSKSKHEKINPLTLIEQKAFIKVIRDHYHEALFTTALDTGMREGELFALLWSDIDFDKKTIRIDKTYSYVKDIVTEKRVSLVTDPKTKGSDRSIPMANRTKEILEKHKFEQRKALLKIGIPQEDETLVFCTPIATYLDSSNVLKLLKIEYKKIGIDNKTFHDLRHTYATRLFELGEPAKTVQELLGHSSVNITLGTYTHVLDELKEKAVSKIDDIYKEKKEPDKFDPESTGQLSDNLIQFTKLKVL